jgi:hypothetical protein
MSRRAMLSGEGPRIALGPVRAPPPLFDSVMVWCEAAANGPETP